MLLFLLLSFVGVAPERTYKDLVGKWEGEDGNGFHTVLQFIDNQKVIFTVEGEEMPAATYKADFRKNPIWLDIINVVEDEEEILEGIIQFQDRNTIKYQVFPDGDGPRKFDTSDPETIVVLKRKG